MIEEISTTAQTTTDTETLEKKEIDEILEFLLSTPQKPQAEEEKSNPDTNPDTETAIEKTGEDNLTPLKIYSEICMDPQVLQVKYHTRVQRRVIQKQIQIQNPIQRL